MVHTSLGTELHFYHIFLLSVYFLLHMMYKNTELFYYYQLDTQISCSFT